MVSFWSKKLQRFWSICAASFSKLRPFRINPSEIYGGYILVAVHLFSLLSQTLSEHSNRVFFGAKKKIEIRNNVVWEPEKWLTELRSDSFISVQFRQPGNFMSALRGVSVRSIRSNPAFVQRFIEMILEDSSGHRTFQTQRIMRFPSKESAFRFRCKRGFYFGTPAFSKNWSLPIACLWYENAKMPHWFEIWM